MSVHTPLRDLGELGEFTKKKITTEFINEDVSLSSSFKRAFSVAISKSGSEIQIKKATSVITTLDNQKIFFPNQWFVLAAYAVDFVSEIIRYQNITEAVLAENIHSYITGRECTHKKKQKAYDLLRKSNNLRFLKQFKGDILQYLKKLQRKDFSQEQAEKDANLLLRFVTDTDWWFGEKNSSKSKDFYIAPTLSVLNLAKESQSYVATITWLYIHDKNLAKELDTVLKKGDSQVGEHSSENTWNLKKVTYDTDLETNYERNRIVFGAPGTGKSFRLKKDCEMFLKGTAGSYERVTFHPDYTYSQFVGTYKPVSDGSVIRYEFVPGPFLRVYVEAVKNTCSFYPQPYILIIEEINRAKVSAVFGDMFQLLDRDEEGVSEYEIRVSEDIRRYLEKELKCNGFVCEKMKLPNNMFIWATMNSADQSVFFMDTAFKRRWEFEYLGINENQDIIKGRVFIGKKFTQEIVWNVLRRAINEKLAKEYRVNEDKLMGPFFLSKRVLKIVSEEDDRIENVEKFMAAFKSKVLMYLYEDVAKQHRNHLFSGCDDTTKYSAICDSFDEIGIQIFGEDFLERYYLPQKE